jgi:hypothetical protein
MAPIVLPHSLQKALLDYSEERQTEGFPPGPVHCTWSLANSTHINVGDPECFWHKVQEQVCGFIAGAFAANRI